MTRLILSLIILTFVANCTSFPSWSRHRPSDPTPGEVALGEQEVYRWWLADDGTVEYEEDPYTRRQVRRADHDVFVTLLARDVALVVEPAVGAPIGVSNMLAAALVRRFAGQLPLKEALGASKVFLIRPQVSGDSAEINGSVVVDWRLRNDRRGDVGVVYASKRLSGFRREDDPWSAFTYDDAEHIALQSASQLLEAPEVRAAVETARNLAKIEASPNPRPRPQDG
ncbi:MAG: hypothetical protein AAF401_13890 [Pseudomonadota bacterium]